jgi:hypothetical protein
MEAGVVEKLLGGVHLLGGDRHGQDLRNGIAPRSETSRFGSNDPPNYHW